MVEKGHFTQAKAWVPRLQEAPAVRNPIYHKKFYPLENQYFCFNFQRVQSDSMDKRGKWQENQKGDCCCSNTGKIKRACPKELAARTERRVQIPEIFRRLNWQNLLSVWMWRGWRDGKEEAAKDDSQAFDFGDLVPPPHEIQQCSQTLGFQGTVNFPTTLKLQQKVVN